MSNRDRLRDEYDANQEALGVTEERQDFFDDANAALGIGYSATMEAGRSKRILKAREEAEAAEIVRRNALREQDANIDRTVNKGAARHYAMLRNEGYDHETAMAMTANAEYEAQDDHEPDVVDEYLGDTTENLMRPDYAIAKGGGGGSGRKRSKSENVPVCMVCHLVACVCSKGKTKHGYKDPDQIRPEMVGARISTAAKSALQETGYSYGELLESIAQMLLAGVPLEQLQRTLGLDDEAA